MVGEEPILIHFGLSSPMNLAGVTPTLQVSLPELLPAGSTQLAWTLQQIIKTLSEAQLPCLQERISTC